MNDTFPPVVTYVDNISRVKFLYIFIIIVINFKYRLDAEAKGSTALEYLKTYINPEGKDRGIYDVWRYSKGRIDHVGWGV